MSSATSVRAPRPASPGRWPRRRCSRPRGSLQGVVQMGVASTWTVMLSAPAVAMSATWRSGRSTIRWTSIRPPASWTRSASAPTTSGSEGDRRHEVAVHDVDVDHPRPGVEHLLDLRAEAGEVGRQDRRGDPPLAQQPVGPSALRPSDGLRACCPGSGCRPRSPCSTCARSSSARRSWGTPTRARSAAGSRRSGSGPGTAVGRSQGSPQFGHSGPSLGSVRFAHHGRLTAPVHASRSAAAQAGDEEAVGSVTVRQRLEVRCRRAAGAGFGVNSGCAARKRLDHGPPLSAREIVHTE